MARKNITATVIENLKPAKPGQRYDVMDTQAPGFGIRVTDGKKVGGVARGSFIFVGRFPDPDKPGQVKSPTRAALAPLGAMSLEDAREKARQWRNLIRAGKDPRIEEARQIEAQQAAEARRRRDTFATVAEAYIADQLPGQRKGKEVAADIRRDMIPAWGTRPVAEIARLDVKDLINWKKATAPAQARNLLGTVKRLFTWAINEEVYGLDVSPAGSLKAMHLLGEKPRDNRALDDDELRAFCHAVRHIPYPVGPVYRLLLLTGLRLNEVADASWKEFHPRLGTLLRKNREPVSWRDIPQEWKEWKIPDARMKGKNGRAREHLVPLTDEMLELLEQLPRYDDPKGDFVFSISAGKTPVWVGDKIKKAVDRRMLLALRAMARMRGDDPAKVELKHWKNHHLRHTVETRLAKYEVGKEIRDAVLAHAKPGMTGTYNHYDFAAEKRAALELWSGRLRDIITPPPPNVVTLARGTSR